MAEAMFLQTPLSAPSTQLLYVLVTNMNASNPTHVTTMLFKTLELARANVKSALENDDPARWREVWADRWESERTIGDDQEFIEIFKNILQE
jgi:hypothetical protein